MLLTLHLRQGLIRGLRSNGATRLDIVKALLFDALVLGGLAALLGLALGDLLSIAVFRSNPGYLSFAFPVGSQRIVTWQSIAIAAGAGLLAACIGVLIPLREIFSRSTPAAVSGKRHIRRWWTIGALIGGLSCLAATTAILLVGAPVGRPGQRDLGHCIAVAVAAPARRGRRGLRSPASRLRLGVDAHRRDRTPVAQHAGAIDRNRRNRSDRRVRQRRDPGSARQSSAWPRPPGPWCTAATDMWVVPPGTQNLLATTPFRGTAASALARLPGVQSVGLYRAGFLDYGDRRVWVLAPPSATTNPIPPSQLVSGDLALATRQASSWRLGGPLASRRHAESLAYRAAFYAARPIPDELPRRCADHQPRLATGRDHPQPTGLRACLGQRRSECLQPDVAARSLDTAGASGSSAGIGGEVGTCGPDCRAA